MQAKGKRAALNVKNLIKKEKKMGTALLSSRKNGSFYRGGVFFALQREVAYLARAGRVVGIMIVFIVAVFIKYIFS